MERYVVVNVQWSSVIIFRYKPIRRGVRLGVIPIEANDDDDDDDDDNDDDDDDDDDANPAVDARPPECTIGVRNGRNEESSAAPPVPPAPAAPDDDDDDDMELSELPLLSTTPLISIALVFLKETSDRLDILLLLL